MCFSEFIQNMSQATSKCLFIWIKVDKLDYFSDRDIGKILFVSGSYEYLVRLEGKIRDGIFFCINKSDNYSVL